MTHPGRPPRSRGRIFSLLEVILLLGCVPFLVIFMKGQALRHILLLCGCLYVVLRLHGRVSWRFLSGRPVQGWWKGPLVRGGLVFLLGAALVGFTSPEHLFQLPRERTSLWLVLIVLYPLLSVLPQEIIYRVWLFECHPALWSKPLQPIICSALLFGWVHIIYSGWFAVIACVLGGLALAWNYSVNRAHPGALWPLILEHALYGLSMFTVGLGRYFFIPR